MRSLFKILLLVLLSLKPLKAQLQWVDPFIGTGGHGHTYPGATAPFGMVQLSPDTRLDGWDGCSGYHYSDSAIYGFSHTHLSGTGVSDYGDVLLMPMTELAWNAEEVKQGFSHDHEEAHPGYYSVELYNGVEVALTASPRVGVHRYTFPKGTSAYVLIDLLHRDQLLSASLEVIDERNLNGHRHSTAWARNQQFFFHLRTSEPWEEVLSDAKHENHRKALRFKRLKKPLTIWVGLSSTSAEAALRNLEAEAGHQSFEEVQANTRALWEAELGKIEIEGSEEQKRIFYTALYHTQIVPNVFNDVDGQYRGMDQQIHQAETDHYTVFSLWDTYRATHPLYTLIDHQRTADFLHTFDRMQQQTGRLPVWELAGNETECMIGYHGASVLADAVAKNLSPLAPQRALAMALESAQYGAFGMDIFRKKGFLEIEDEHESVSKTLEYAYDDFCVAVLADAAAEPEIAETYRQSAQAYRHVLDAEGFMHPRSNGRWLPDFDPRQVNSHFTEANSWQYSFYVPHDLQGYINQLGGAARLEAQLDALFTADENTTGRQQADITGLIGQYAHGNEPSHHIAYLYNAIGKPHKTQERVRQILEEQYHDQPDGLSGNEDCGQMSAWYVWSSLGFYPLCPGDPNYVIGYPLFPRATVQLGNGRKLLLSTRGSGNYIQSIRWNGEIWRANFISHQRLMEGGEMEFYLAEQPTEWGTQYEERYNTWLGREVSPVPVLAFDREVFTDSLLVSWSTRSDAEAWLRWNEEEWQPAAGDHVWIKESGTLSIVEQINGRRSAVNQAHFHRRSQQFVARWINEPGAEYRAGGPEALVDEVLGDEEWRKGRWIGVQGRPFIAEIDLLEPQTLGTVGLSCLQDVRSWIVFPTQIAFYGKLEQEENWRLLGEFQVGDRIQEEGCFKEAFTLPLMQSCRYLRVEAMQYGTLPDWHLGAGNQSHLFVDEVLIECGVK